MQQKFKYTVNINSRHHKSTFFLYFIQLNVTVVPKSVNETPVKDRTAPFEHCPEYLSTINFDTLNGFREEDQLPEIPSAEKCAAQEVGAELIGTCVTPSRIKTIQHLLSKPEAERHLCALKLLPHFFSKEELAETNTEGSHDKKCLDSTKLNSLKILVFSKFPVSTSEDGQSLEDY